jgi:hypothetical protein
MAAHEYQFGGCGFLNVWEKAVEKSPKLFGRGAPALAADG